MTLLIQIAQFIFIISILVILHELGHFIPAKLFKTKVEKFYLFFDYKFSLFKKKIGDTEYGIGWIPFGGYVKIAGMIDESMDKEQMKLPPKPWEFRSKPAWQRLIIMLGGVTVNFFLAWFIYSAMLMYYGEQYVDNSKLDYGVYVDGVGEKLGIKKGDKIVSIDGKPLEQFGDAAINILLGDKMTVNRNGKNITFPLKDEIKKLVLENQGKRFITEAIPSKIGFVGEEYAANKAGILKGDIITSVNDKKINYWQDLVKEIRSNKDKDLNLLINRNDELVNLTIRVPDSLIIGISSDIAIMKKAVVTKEYTLATSIPRGFEQTIDVLVKQVRQFKLVFNKQVQGYKHMKGPIGIVTIMSPTWDWQFVWRFMAMFSVWLAFLNLLPIPALDGGH
ncbi:MAG TPA: RIP metalloprotease RseP, partial [Flavobacteriaceae bacterium]|nr:RIP metalloprotease RseP [Flavobacteriaceae bacterium]